MNLYIVSEMIKTPDIKFKIFAEIFFISFDPITPEIIEIIPKVITKLNFKSINFIYPKIANILDIERSDTLKAREICVSFFKINIK